MSLAARRNPAPRDTTADAAPGPARDFHPAAGARAPADAVPALVTVLQRRALERWYRTDPTPPDPGPPLGRRTQRANARAARRLIDELAVQVEAYPTSPAARAAWRAAVRERVRRFGESHLGWPAGYRRLLFADAFFDSSRDFARDARRLDPDLRLDDLLQALRNVWIINSLQMLLDLEVRSTPAAFAYSMLYPLTDNYLDDPAVSGTAKRRFNRRLGRRLAGDPLRPGDAREGRVFRMVETIEGQYDRRRFPAVYQSLLAIHRAQSASLAQHDGGPTLTADDLLALSVAKGGSSVLADGYLVAGELSAGEAELCFGYGVFLQLLDDLQDVRVDRAAGHRTLFSQPPAGDPLDALVSRLYAFMHATIDDAPRCVEPAYAERRDLILRNCTWLLVGAVAAHRERFSRPYVRRLEARWPLRFAPLNRLRRRGRRVYRRTARSLRRRWGVGSLLDLLLEAPAG